MPRPIRCTSTAATSCGTPTIILACGVAWRHVAIEGFDRLAGRGIFYGAARSEAANTHGLDIHIIGAGNGRAMGPTRVGGRSPRQRGRAGRGHEALRDPVVDVDEAIERRPLEDADVVER